MMMSTSQLKGVLPTNQVRSLLALAMAIAVAAATVPTTAQAQPCPNKPIKVVVESAAGTQNDIWARRYSERMAQSMQANIIVKTLAEFQQRAKANPGEFVCGNSGHAGFGHFACAMVERALGIKMLMAPYKGPVMVDLIAGHIQTSLGFSAELEPHVAPGKLTVLASFAPKRLPKFPNAPTFAEAGFPNMEMPGWNAFFSLRAHPKRRLIASTQKSSKPWRLDRKWWNGARRSVASTKRGQPSSSLTLCALNTSNGAACRTTLASRWRL
jgi:tripartite-type tricarboxylate transporter receptor subunit TctC